MIPDYQTLMLPLLKLVSDGQEHKYRDIIENLKKKSTEALTRGIKIIAYSVVNSAIVARINTRVA